MQNGYLLVWHHRSGEIVEGLWVFLHVLLHHSGGYKKPCLEVDYLDMYRHSPIFHRIPTPPLVHDTYRLDSTASSCHQLKRQFHILHKARLVHSNNLVASNYKVLITNLFCDTHLNSLGGDIRSKLAVYLFPPSPCCRPQFQIDIQSAPAPSIHLPTHCSKMHGPLPFDATQHH